VTVPRGLDVLNMVRWTNPSSGGPAPRPRLRHRPDQLRDARLLRVPDCVPLDTGRAGGPGPFNVVSAERARAFSGLNLPSRPTRSSVRVAGTAAGARRACNSTRAPRRIHSPGVGGLAEEVQEQEECRDGDDHQSAAFRNRRESRAPYRPNGSERQP